MTSSIQQYKGSYPYKTDAKGRVTVLPAWRPAQGEVLNLMTSFSEGVKVIKVLSQKDFESRIATIEKHATSPKEEAKLKTQLVRLLREATVNEQGKLLIPKDMAEYAGIAPESEVTLSAGASHFEIWPRDKFEEVFGLSAVPEEEDHLSIF
ncbi:MAG: hypothetical protein ABJQ29_14330 [Luteolibacter sp.]